MSWPAIAIMLCVVATVLGMPSGCQTQPVVERPLPPRPLPTTEPAVRVRIERNVGSETFTANGGLWIGPPGAANWLPMRQRFEKTVTIVRRVNQFIIVEPGGRTLGWALHDLMIVGYYGDPVLVNGNPYPHTIVLHALSDNLPGGTFDVINHVKLETYLPGVLQKELYSNWHPAAFRAQAIAARTYALDEAWNHPSGYFDLESTTASQAYVGARAGARAVDAAQRTEGAVLTYDGRIFPAYYSSCCGGTSQDAAAAFPDGPDIPPLQGHSHEGWCQQCPYYRWGPIERPADSLARRMAAWGAQAKDPIAQLKSIAAVTIAQTNSAGRPTRFVITDRKGKRFALGPESFRFACNQSAPGLADLPKDKQLLSSFVQVNVVGNVVRFTDGRGFGHGVGLCQWGAQAMAVQGYSEFQILGKYYPGAKITQLY